ncbi:MAG: family 20 glycosylhydrolase [Planctomycetota bacterium]|nr:family 20 glycosylhydrolase [Planctomycetota bacterium]
MRTDRLVGRVVLSALLVCPAWAAGAGDEPPGLLPTPKSIVRERGNMPLTARSRIVATFDKLLPAARVLSHEIYVVTGLKLTPVYSDGRAGQGEPGDIVLKINPLLRADDEIVAVENRKIVRTQSFAHSIVVGEMAVVEGFDYRAVCEGTSTLVQALIEKDGKFLLPKMTVKDWPAADYLAIMVDCARQEIPVFVLRKMVDNARFYKVRYLHLHLSDDHAYTFPLRRYPKMGGHNRAHCEGDAPKIYDLQQLKDLVAYADARGVTIVPELETPGHSDAIRLDLPDELDRPKSMGGGARLAMMNIADDKIYPVLDGIVAEMCGVFRSSPYFHIGCDEVNSGPLMGQPWVKPFLEKNGIKDGFGGLMKRHVGKMKDIVTKYGKVPILWSGPPLDPAMKDSVIVMTWTADGGSAQAFADGFATITTPWDLGPFAQWSLYLCNGTALDRRRNRVIGANQPMWEMSAQCLSGATALTRQERSWGPDNVIDEPEFKTRTEALTARATRLLAPVKIETVGKVDKENPWLRTSKEFSGALGVKLSTENPFGRIHYTLDGSEPAARSTAYTGPFQVSKTVRLRAALFDGAGGMLGNVALAKFVHTKPAPPEKGK